MKYELTVHVKGDIGSWDVKSFDKIMADSLVSLLSQFIVLITSYHRLEMEASGKINDDDIPF